MNQDQRLFRRKELRFTPVFGLMLILLFGIPRFIIVLQANVSGNYGLTSILFLLMWALPFLILTKNGRQKIGIVKPTKPLWVGYGFILGILLAVVIGVVGQMFYNQNNENWFFYISRSYQLPDFTAAGHERFSYFLIFAIVGMTFSPIGEELLYRGIIHQSFTKKYGENGASIIDSLGFSVTHLAHFGIIYYSGIWSFLFIPSLIWIIFMFAASRMFFIIKLKSGSILGAIFSHAGFNLGMTWYIFYQLM
jgi:membrane protease YdiL (CAAX protease family)